MKNKVNEEDNEFIQASIKRGSKCKEVIETLCDKDIIKQFIDTENFALVKDVQGHIYPDYHYEIKRIMATTMKNFSDREKLYTFYHTLSLGGLYTIHKKNYHLFQKAFALLVPRILTQDCYYGGGGITIQFIFFNVFDKTNDKKFENISYDDFVFIKKFIGKSNSYGDYDTMYKKSDKILIYKDNDVLTGLLEKNLPLYFESKYFEFSYTLAGIMVLLMASDDKREKEILSSLNSCNFHDDSSKWLKRFYTFFQDSDVNKELLNDLNKTIK